MRLKLVSLLFARFQVHCLQSFILFFKVFLSRTIYTAVVPLSQYPQTSVKLGSLSVTKKKFDRCLFCAITSSRNKRFSYLPHIVVMYSFSQFITPNNLAFIRTDPRPGRNGLSRTHAILCSRDARLTEFHFIREHQGGAWQRTSLFLAFLIRVKELQITIN